jgi:hypothetical protein
MLVCALPGIPIDENISTEQEKSKFADTSTNREISEVRARLDIFREE